MYTEITRQFLFTCIEEELDLTYYVCVVSTTTKTKKKLGYIVPPINWQIIFRPTN
jgi:hypothetical protein